MPAVFLLQERAFEGGDDLAVNPGPLAEGIEQSGGNDQDFTAGVQGHVVEFRMEADRQVGRQGPGSRGPDNQGGILSRQGRHLAGDIILERKFYINGRRAVIGVLHLGLGQGGTAGRAPVHRLLALEEPAVCGEFRQLPGGDPLIEVVHGQVRVFPFTQDAEPFEFLALYIHELGGIIATKLPHFRLGDLVLFRAEVLLHLQFDGQAMAIPARHIGRLEAAHPLALQHDILQDLIEGMADMDMAVGIGRTIMENVFRLFPAHFGQLFIEAHLRPFPEDFHLFLGKICLHREAGFRQVQSFFVFHGVPSYLLNQF